MEKIITVNKKIGQTPLEAIHQTRKDYNIPDEVNLAYAGRLDPAAHGLLLILVGDECKNRDKYQSLDKEYIFKIILGLSTDTFDLLGVIQNIKNNISEKDADYFIDNIKKYSRVYTQKYPPYSSYHVKGKPLFWWAREQRLNEIKIPKKQVEILDLEIISTNSINKVELFEKQTTLTQIVKGDFRQDQIKDSWLQNKNKIDENLYQITVKIRVKSGFYVRQFVNDLENKTQIPCAVSDIFRTRVGGFSISTD